MLYAHILILLLVQCLFVFMYHYERNGNPVSLGDTAERILWALSFSVGYGLIHWDLGIMALYFVGQLIAIYIPHAFAQQMGRRLITWPQMGPWTKYWPGWPFMWVKDETIQDFGGMAVVGLLRGLVVFIPPIFLGASLWGAVIAIIITEYWQPCAYYLGWKVPFTLWGNTARSAQWGEFFVPIGWAAALLSAVVL